jgi:hypothetical protein
MIEKIYEIEKKFVERPKKFREDIANCELVNNMRGGFLLCLWNLCTKHKSFFIWLSHKLHICFHFSFKKAWIRWRLLVWNGQICV